MLLYHTDSWHYKLVLYVLGKNFFTEKDKIDFEASEKKMQIVWTRKPRIVNFCPYCRAILYSVLSLPFVYLWKKLPHKPKKEKTHQEIMKSLRRKNIAIRFIAGGVNIALGIQKIFQQEYGFAFLQILIGVILIIVFQYPQFFSPGLKKLAEFIIKYWPKKKEKKSQTKKPKQSPSLIRTYFTKNHDKFCPPVAFVDPNDTEIRR